jgi:hypothetical protein
MKLSSLILTLVIGLTSTLTWAQHDRERFERDFDRRPHPDAHWHPDAGWVVPAIIGGALVYSAINSAPAPAPAQSTYYPVQVNQPQLPPPGYHWAQIFDANCNCNRVVLVQN